MKSLTRWLTLFSALMLTAAVSIAAQAPPAPPAATAAPAENMNLVREKLRADKKLLVAQNMQMTEAEAAAFWPVYDAFQADLAKLSDNAVTLVTYYGNNYRSMSDTAATRMLDQFIAIERDQAALLQSYRPRFSAVLPPLKVARYYQIENKIRAILNYELAKGIPLM
jgi:cobalamin biosynthesis Mg chelatase CobN